jgi:thiamine-monophosphate kinase
MSHDRLSEQGFIRLMHRTVPAGAGVRVGIGDDCAVLEPTQGRPLLVTTDLLLEEVHFRRRYTTPADIGWKALAVNLSDIAAMGGTPRWAVVAVGCPGDVGPQAVGEFADSIWEIASAHGVAVVGGDTSESPGGWVVNVTLVGEASGVPKLRSGANPGDLIAVTGPLGRSAAGLARLDRFPDDREELALAHLRPIPRVREGQALGGLDGVTAMIDLSDGLATDLEHVARQSGVGARVDLSRLPIDAATRAAARVFGVDPLTWATSGGEDYELLVTLAADTLSSATALVSLTVIGEITRAPAIEYIGLDGRGATVEPGFQHFASPRLGIARPATSGATAPHPPRGNPGERT